MTTPDIEIRQMIDDHRFEILVSGERIGLANYRDDAGQRVFIHTETDPEHQGQGLAAKLITAALDKTRDEGLRVVPECSYVKAFIEQHPEYADLVGDGSSR